MENSSWPLDHITESMIYGLAKLSAAVPELGSLHDMGVVKIWYKGSVSTSITKSDERYKVSPVALNASK